METYATLHAICERHKPLLLRWSATQTLDALVHEPMSEEARATLWNSGRQFPSIRLTEEQFKEIETVITSRRYFIADSTEKVWRRVLMRSVYGQGQLQYDVEIQSMRNFCREVNSHFETNPQQAGRIVPVSSFNLSSDIERKLKIARGYTAAFAIHWAKDNPSIVMWYDPKMPTGLGPTDLGGGEINPADFLDIIHLNPDLKRYEFGLTGKPKSALVVIVEGAETEAWVAPLRLVDSLMGVDSNRVKKAIRDLV